MARNVWDTSFYGILIDKSNYNIILVIQGYLQGQFQFYVTKSQFQDQKDDF